MSYIKCPYCKTLIDLNSFDELNYCSTCLKGFAFSKQRLITKEDKSVDRYYISGVES